MDSVWTGGVGGLWEDVEVVETVEGCGDPGVDSLMVDPVVDCVVEVVVVIVVVGAGVVVVVVVVVVVISVMGKLCLFMKSSVLSVCFC